MLLWGEKQNLSLERKVFKTLNLVPFTLAFLAHPGVFTSGDKNLHCSDASEK